jgi:hypothetical protein
MWETQLRRAQLATMFELWFGAGPQPPASSRAEVKVARLLRHSGLSEPLRQYEVLAAGRWRRLAFAWPARRVALEVGVQATPLHEALVAAGWRVLLVTERDVAERSPQLVARVAEALAAAA